MDHFKRICCFLVNVKTILSADPHFITRVFKKEPAIFTAQRTSCSGIRSKSLNNSLFYVEKVNANIIYANP